MAMLQPPTKPPKFVPLRMSELMPAIIALQEAADDELNSSKGSLDRSFSEINTENQRNPLSNYETETTYPNDNFCKNSFLSDSRNYNQTYPSNDNKTSHINQTPMKTPNKSKQSSVVKFKTRTPRSSAKKFTPSRLRLKESTFKNSLKKTTPTLKTSNVSDSYRSARKCALFPKQTCPSIQPPLSVVEPPQKHILKPTEELLATPLNKCSIVSPEINRKNKLTENRALGVDSLDRVSNLPHIPRTNHQYPSDRFGTPQSANLSVNSILKGCLENDAIVQSKPSNPFKMRDYHTPIMRNNILQTHNRVVRTPLFPIKPEQFPDVRNDSVKNYIETHEIIQKSQDDNKENHLLCDTNMDKMQSFSEINDLNSNISDEDLKMITASWEMSGIERSVSLSKDIRRANDSSFMFDTSIKSNSHGISKSNTSINKHELQDKDDHLNSRNVLNNSSNSVSRQQSIFKPKTSHDNNIVYNKQHIIHPEEHHAPKNNPFPTSLNINYQSTNPSMTKMDPPKTFLSNEAVHKQLTPFCPTDRNNKVETTSRPRPPVSNHQPCNINENRVDDLNKIIVPMSDNNHFKNPTLLSKGEERNVNMNNANTLSKEFKTLTVKGRYYTILGKLGAGGSSEVYKVMDPETTSMYAVKCVNLAVDHSLAQGYVNEIKLLQRLQGSDKVITLLDHEYLERQKRLYVVLEMGETDLSTLMKSYSTRGSRLPLLILMAYWTEMLAAVNYIHENGVIHSDLKPANFLLVHGRLKLIDFGIASSISGDATSVVKDSATGTFNYISPEAIAGDRQPIKITYKSDTWSLGCILYSMIYGRTPFSHVTQLWAKIAALSNPNQKIDYPDVKGIPPVLMKALKWCLTFDVKKRPSVQQLIDLPYVYQGIENHSQKSAKMIPVSILAKMRQALTEEEWRKVVDVLETT